MPVARGTLNVSDSRRDAEKYYSLLLAIESAIEKISRLEKEGRANIDEVLASLLPDLAESLGAAQAFVAVYRQDKKNRVKGFDVVAVHPKVELDKPFLPWSKPLSQVMSDGKACVVEPFEDTPRKLIEGLEAFDATTALLVRMRIGGQAWIVGVCNRANPEMGPFLATDRRALESIIELIAIGIRMGERRRQELENIQKISAAINAEVNPDELLPLIAQKAAEVFSAPAVSLMLWDKKRENLIIEASYGLTVDYVKRQRISRKRVDAIIAKYENARAFVTSDLQRTPFGKIDLIKTECLRSALRAQLQVCGELIGILNIYSQDTLRTFNADELDLAEIFANHAAIAIHNARLRQRKLEGILDTSEALKATFDEAELLQLIVWKVNGVFNAPVDLMFWDAASENLVIKASYGLSDDRMKRQFVIRDAALKRRGSKPFIVGDLGLAPHGLHDIYEKEQLFNALVAPLASPGTKQASGFLFIYGQTGPREFTSEEMKIAGIIADQAAIAIRTTQLHGQNKQRGEQLNALDQIALDIAGELDIRGLLESIIRRATELVHAKDGVVYIWNEKKAEIRPVAACGDPDLVTIKVNKNRGIIREIIRTKAPLAVTNYYRWSKRQTSLDKYRLTGVVGVPILSEEHLLGVIAVHDIEEGRSFSKADEELLQRFANHAAIAIENANAYAAEHETKNYLDGLITSSLDGIIAVDEEGYITLYNEGAERICGYSQDEILSQKTRVEKIYGDLGAAQHINRILFRQGRLDNFETILHAKNGQKIPIVLSATLLREKDGNHKGSVGFFKDLRPLRATLDTITAVTEARDLTAGLNALAEGMVKSLGITFCHILFLEPNGRSLKVKATHPVSRLHGEPFTWHPETGKILDLEIASPMKQLLQKSEPVVYRREEIEAGIAVTNHIQKSAGLEVDLQSVLLLPLKSNNGTFGICTLGEVRKWERSPFTEEKIRLGRSIADQAAGLIHRLQTYEALRLREGLLEAGKKITSLQDLPTILQSISDGVREALNCDLVTLYIYSGAKDKIDLPTISGQLNNRDALYALGYVSKKSIVWKILESSEPHFAEDAKHDPWMILDEADRHPGVEPFVLREGIASSAGIPLIMGNERVGILFASYHSPHSFSDLEKSDIQIFATQAAMAIHNARIYDIAETKRKHFKALYDAGKTLIGDAAFERRRILQKILEQAVESVTSVGGEKVTLGAIQIFDPSKNALVFECVYPESDFPKLIDMIGEGLSLTDQKGITLRVARTKHYQLVPDVSKDEDYLQYNAATRSELAVPLLDQGQLLGVLDVESEKINAFDLADAEALQALADLAVLVLKNAEQYIEMEKTKNYLLTSQAVAWLGLFGADLQHTIHQKAFSLDNYVSALRLWHERLDPPPDGIKDVFQILEGIEAVSNNIRAVQFASQAPVKLPGDAGTYTEIDKELASIFKKLGSARSDVERELRLHCPGVKAMIAPQGLRVALEKLVNNAFKAMPDGGHLRIDTERSGNMVNIRIKDTGHGIPEESLPYFLTRVVPRKRIGEGTGTGVLIARFVALSHGGDLVLVSTSPEGTELLITLPIAEREA